MRTENALRPETQSAYRRHSIELAAGVLKALPGRLFWALDHGHAEGVGRYARLLSLHLRLSALEAAQIGSAATLHDVGKIGLPDSLLQKVAPLDDNEWEIVKRHPLIGASLLSGNSTPVLNLARLIALTHHENWDGSGYPNGIQGESIPLAGRITMLVDRYDALRSRRPYKAALSHKRTCEVLLLGDGRSEPKHFDPRVLEAFRKNQDQFSAVPRSAPETLCAEDRLSDRRGAMGSLRHSVTR
jgi:putative two-component system response regulator